MGLCNWIEYTCFLSLFVLSWQSLHLFEFLNSNVFVDEIEVMLEILIVSVLNHALDGLVGINILSSMQSDQGWQNRKANDESPAYIAGLLPNY